MFLLIFSGLWIFVLEDEVDLDSSFSSVLTSRLKVTYFVGGTALVGAKHDDVGRGIREFLRV